MNATAISAAVILIAAGFSAPASAALITNGFTFSVASSSSNQAVGTHYHSNTGGSFGNPAGKAEVGRFGTEEVRGLSEYNLTGLAPASSAFFTFDVFKAGGLFTGTNDQPFVGSITIYAYAGNNLENISDYQAASLGTIGSFSTAGLAVDDVLSFDITSLFNAAITGSQTSLGIRLQSVPLNPLSQAWTFEDFRLTSDSLCTSIECQPKPVPEPGTLALLGLGLAGLGFSRRRKAH